jgi:hypothetical protein
MYTNIFILKCGDLQHLKALLCLSKNLISVSLFFQEISILMVSSQSLK